MITRSLLFSRKNRSLSSEYVGIGLSTQTYGSTSTEALPPLVLGPNDSLEIVIVRDTKCQCCGQSLPEENK